MQVYQIFHVKYCLDKKTKKPIFGKGFFTEQEGSSSTVQYAAPVLFMKDKKQLSKFLKYQQASILRWNRGKTLRTNKLNSSCLKVEFEPKGNGYPCEMYKAVKVNLPNEFMKQYSFDYSDQYWND